MPAPIPPAQRHRLQGVRLAGPDPVPSARLTIQQNVSSRGGIQVTRQRIQAGLSDAGKTVTIQPGGTTLRIIDSNGELTITVPRHSAGEISRFQIPRRPACWREPVRGEVLLRPAQEHKRVAPPAGLADDGHR